MRDNLHILAVAAAAVTAWVLSKSPTLARLVWSRIRRNPSPTPPVTPPAAANPQVAAIVAGDGDGSGTQPAWGFVDTTGGNASKNGATP